MRPQITKYLDECFGCIPGDGHITISMYMTGESAEKASPTLLFISKGPKTRKEARKATKESGTTSRFPEFQAKYVSKDPGSLKIEDLASNEKGDSKSMFPNVAAEVLFDITMPLRVLGMPVYVRHSVSIRTATANVVRIGDRKPRLLREHTGG